MGAFATSGIDSFGDYGFDDIKGKKDDNFELVFSADDKVNSKTESKRNNSEVNTDKEETTKDIISKEGGFEDLYFSDSEGQIVALNSLVAIGDFDDEFQERGGSEEDMNVENNINTALVERVEKDIRDEKIKCATPTSSIIYMVGTAVSFTFFLTCLIIDLIKNTSLISPYYEIMGMLGSLSLFTTSSFGLKYWKKNIITKIL